MPPERVSIITPFFRAGHYLQEAIESVLDQRGYSDWHLYLINDASDDSDVQIARQFCLRYPLKMTFLESGEERLGTSGSRNLAIRHSAGEFIALLDADDTWYSHKLAYQVPLLDRWQAADMMYGPALRWRSWDGGSDLSVPASVDDFGTDCLVEGSALLSTYLRDESLTPCTGSVLIRSAAAKRVGYYEEQFQGLYDDQVFYAKLCTSSRVFVSSECVSKYRLHPHSCCRQAEVSNAGAAARERFLSWLRQYKEGDSSGHPALALPSS